MCGEHSLNIISQRWVLEAFASDVFIYSISCPRCNKNVWTIYVWSQDPFNR